jgi:hypothetical protein
MCPVESVPLAIVEEELRAFLQAPEDARTSPTILTLGGYPRGSFSDLREILNEAIVHGVPPELQGSNGNVKGTKRHEGARALLGLDSRKPGTLTERRNSFAQITAPPKRTLGPVSKKTVIRRYEPALLREIAAGVLSHSIQLRDGLGITLEKGSTSP